MDLLQAIKASMSNAKGMTSATAASFLAKTSTEGAAPTVNIVIDAPEAMSKAKGMTSATAASFLAEKSTEGAALPKVNVVMDAPDAPLQSSDYMAAAMRASKASTGVTLFGAEAMDVLHAIKASMSKAKGMTSANAASFLAE